MAEAVPAVRAAADQVGTNDTVVVARVQPHLGDVLLELDKARISDSAVIVFLLLRPSLCRLPLRLYGCALHAMSASSRSNLIIFSGLASRNAKRLSESVWNTLPTSGRTSTRLQSSSRSQCSCMVQKRFHKSLRCDLGTDENERMWSTSASDIMRDAA